MLLVLGLPVPVWATQHLSKRHTRGTGVQPKLVCACHHCRRDVSEDTLHIPCRTDPPHLAASHGILYEGYRLGLSDARALVIF